MRVTGPADSPRKPVGPTDADTPTDTSTDNPGRSLETTTAENELSADRRRLAARPNFNLGGLRMRLSKKLFFRPQTLSADCPIEIGVRVSVIPSDFRTFPVTSGVRPLTITDLWLYCTVAV